MGPLLFSEDGDQAPDHCKHMPSLVQLCPTTEPRRASGTHVPGHVPKQNASLWRAGTVCVHLGHPDAWQFLKYGNSIYIRGISKRTEGGREGGRGGGRK